MKRGAAALGVVAIICAPLFTFAQSTNTPPDAPHTLGAASTEMPAGLTSCFNYYTFGSIQVSLSPNLNKVAAGAPIGFQGTITNNNPYPVIDAAVYVKVFRQRDTSGAKDPNGPDVVDLFQAAGPITLQAGQSEPISFIWQVPRAAKDGDYQVAAYVASSDRFNFAGLTFTDDVVGSLTPFQVILGQTGSVGFDKTSVMVGSVPFFFAAFPPSVSSTSSVAVSANIVNTTGAATRASITWDLYSWDSITPGSLINEQTQQVTVVAHATTTVSYTATDTSHSVYYLVGTLTDGKTKSIVGIRFVRQGVDTPRLSFAGVTSYPLTSSSSLFVCTHDTNDNVASGTTMTVQIVPTDPVERIVDSLIGTTPTLSYTGAIPGQEVALANNVKATPTSFNVVASLYQNGALVDTVSIPYICSALGSSCGYSYTDVAAISIVIILVLSLLLFAVARRRSSSDLTYE